MSDIKVKMSDVKCYLPDTMSDGRKILISSPGFAINKLSRWFQGCCMNKSNRVDKFSHTYSRTSLKYKHILGYTLY